MVQPIGNLKLTNCRRHGEFRRKNRAFCSHFSSVGFFCKSFPVVYSVSTFSAIPEYHRKKSVEASESPGIFTDMSRRVIQPPGGASNIFMGNDDGSSTNDYKSARQQNDEKKAAAEKNGNGNQGGDADVKKPASESSDQSQHANSESNRNKDRQKSSIVFGNSDDSSTGPTAAQTKNAGDSATQSAAHNKAGQTHRSYNLITGEANPEDSAPKNGNGNNDAKKDAGEVKAPQQQQQQQHDAPTIKPSTKVFHPPGGKSSGPLW
ncbi:hypothetical protein BV898_18058 [Hypsibius exemplaris]|uniref:Microtubule-associated protein Jupiter n=1 Tax=Hypsibius exemplaris TaxID=2072580 RepID=A0A9X6NGI7_HYPEX|nr:hypothetical protein BV898_18058 [Hypsibius exemplaris]